jgi:hypothetical protein
MSLFAEIVAELRPMNAFPTSVDEFVAWHGPNEYGSEPTFAVP